MESIPITAERKTELEEFTRSRGQNAAALLDDVLAQYLAWERRDFQQAVEAIREGYEDLRAGRTQPAEEVFEELRLKHGLPG